MRAMNCDMVTDLLSELALERLDAASRAGLDEHLAHCRACSAELDLLRGLRAARPVPPSDLYDRALAAARRPRPRWASGHLALAASLVFAILAGGLVLAPNGLLRGTAGAPRAAETGSQAVSVSLAVDDPLLHGGPGLNRLSEDELERLLAEMGS